MGKNKKVSPLECRPTDARRVSFSEETKPNKRYTPIEPQFGECSTSNMSYFPDFGMVLIVA